MKSAVIAEKVGESLLSQFGRTKGHVSALFQLRDRMDVSRTNPRKCVTVAGRVR